MYRFPFNSALRAAMLPLAVLASSLAAPAQAAPAPNVPSHPVANTGTMLHNQFRAKDASDAVANADAAIGNCDENAFDAARKKLDGLIGEAKIADLSSFSERTSAFGGDRDKEDQEALENLKAELGLLWHVAQPCDPPAGGITVELYAGGSASRVETNSDFGIGTVVSGGGHEKFGAVIGRWVDRTGFSIGAEADLGGPGLALTGPQSEANVRVGVRYSSGSESNSGSATVGVGGVTQVALTYLQDNNPGGAPDTGLFSAVGGDVLDSRAKINNDWTLVTLGYSESFTPNGPGGPKVSLGGAVIYEHFKQDFSGQADIVRAGVSLAGQETRGKTENKYYGYEFNAGVTVPVTGKLSAGIEGYVTPAWYTGDASLFQSTDLSNVTQRSKFSDDGFTVSGGIRTHVKYDFTQNVSLKLSYEYSMLGGVSELHVPANPGEQPSFFDSDPIDRHFARVEIEMKISDRRLKRDIAHLTTLDNGIKLYSFKYLWDDQTHVGVMAQDLLANKTFRDAVVLRASGFYAVNYGKLGLKMTTLEAWQESGLAAVMLTPALDRHVSSFVSLPAQ